MKSYIFAAAALISAVAHGAVLKRHESEAPTTLPCGANSTTPYTVVSGDTLNKISGRTGAGVCDIAVANNITNINLINLGQVLYIPDCTSTIDNTTCVTFPDKPATETCVPGLPSTYAVVSGDTLTSIAQDFNITLAALIADNSQISNPDAIGVAQVINIPVCPNSQCASVGTYNILSGDLYVDLAHKYQTTIGQIKALNAGILPTALEVGEQIILPKYCANVTAVA